MMAIATATPCASKVFDLRDLSHIVLRDTPSVDIAVATYSSLASLGANILLTKTYLENVILQAIASDQLMQYLFGCRQLTALPRCGLKVLTELFRNAGLYPAGAEMILARFANCVDRVCQTSMQWKSTVHKQKLIHARDSAAGRTTSLLPHWKKMIKSSMNFYVEMESADYKVQWNDVSARTYRKRQLRQSSTSQEEEKWYDTRGAIEQSAAKILATSPCMEAVEDECFDLYESPEGWMVLDTHGDHYRQLTISTTPQVSGASRNGGRRYCYQCYYMENGCPVEWLENLDSDHLYQTTIVGVNADGDIDSDVDYDDDYEMSVDKKVVDGWIAQAVDNETLAHRARLKREQEEERANDPDILADSASDTDDDDMKGQRLRRMLKHRNGEQFMFNVSLTPSAQEESKTSLQDVFTAQMDRATDMVTYTYEEYRINWFTQDRLQPAIMVRHGPTGVLYQSLGSSNRYYNPTTNFDTTSTCSVTELPDSEIDHLLPLIKAYYAIFDLVGQRDLTLYGHPNFHLNLSGGAVKIECKVSKGYNFVTCIATTGGMFSTGSTSTRYVVTNTGKKMLDLVIRDDGEYKIATGTPGDTISKESFLIGWKAGVEQKTGQPCLIKPVLTKPPHPAPTGIEGARIFQNQYHQFDDEDHFLKFGTQVCRIDGVWKLRPFYRCATQGCDRIALYVDNADYKSGSQVSEYLGHAVCVSCSNKIHDARLVDFELYVIDSDTSDSKTIATSPFYTSAPLEYVTNSVIRAEGKFEVKTSTGSSCNRPGIYFFLTRDRLYDLFRNPVLLEQTTASAASIASSV
jgi:hypothetical protein